jgi:hypothetical protein
MLDEWLIACADALRVHCARRVFLPLSVLSVAASTTGATWGVTPHYPAFVHPPRRKKEQFSVPVRRRARSRRPSIVGHPFEGDRTPVGVVGPSFGCKKDAKTPAQKARSGRFSTLTRSKRQS